VVIAPGLTLEALYNERQPLYREYADLTVKTDGLTPDQVVKEIFVQLTIRAELPRSA